MSAFQKPLPLKIFELEDQKRDVFLACFFESMESSHMRVKLREHYLPFELGSDLSIEFTVANYKYQFDSALVSELTDGIICIRKPKVIYKKAL